MIRRWKDSFAQAFLRENLFYGVLFLNKKKDCQKHFSGKKTPIFHIPICQTESSKKYVDMCNLKERNSSIKCRMPENPRKKS